MNKKIIGNSSNILAIDYGLKKIGLALKTKSRGEASTSGNFKNLGDVVDKVVSLVKKESIDIVVLGHPLLENSEKSSFTKKVEKFSRALSACLPGNAKLVMQDEAFSTMEAMERLRSSGKSEKFVQQNKDTYSALLILERFLESGNSYE